jgi:hypothetical protein
VHVRSIPGRPKLAVLIVGVLATGAFVACGGSGSNDEDYVAAVCGASLTFAEGVNDLVRDSAVDDEVQVVEHFAELLRGFASDLRDADPPGDVREAHNTFVDALDNIIAAVEAGGISAMFQVELPDLATAPDVQARLRDVANDTEECQQIRDVFG